MFAFDEELINRVSKTLGRDVKYERVVFAVKDLLNLIDKLQQEYATLSESIAESDAIIEQLHQQIREFKQNSRLQKFYDMAEENLKLAQENARLRELVKA
jgi:phage shock protein A